MMLWSKSFVQSDSMCPKQSVKLRLGESGRSWDGFNVGSYVHSVIAANLSGSELPISTVHLSVEELVSAKGLLDNFDEMGIELPGEALTGTRHCSWPAVIEQSSFSEIDEGGVALGWSACPPWMVRDSGEWDPSQAKGTVWRFQPDAYFISGDGKKITVYDWKTGWGIPSDASLEKDTQAITYCAALCEMYPEAEEAEFVWWNIRWKTGRSVTKARDGWIDLARPIWAACWAKDQLKPEDIVKEERPGEHCGRCPYADSCLVELPDYQKQGDAELYQYSQRLAALTKKVRSDLKARLKDRTSTVEVPGGTVLGPGIKQYSKWKRGEKEDGMSKVMDWLDQGAIAVFDIKGTLGDWLDRLPDDLREHIDEHIEEGSRQILIEKEK
jgi:hypothetical protein